MLNQPCIPEVNPTFHDALSFWYIPRFQLLIFHQGCLQLCLWDSVFKFLFLYIFVFDIRALVVSWIKLGSLPSSNFWRRMGTIDDISCFGVSQNLTSKIISEICMCVHIYVFEDFLGTNSIYFAYVCVHADFLFHFVSWTSIGFYQCVYLN